MKSNYHVLVVDPYKEIVGPHQVAYRFIKELKKNGWSFLVAIPSASPVYEHYKSIGIETRIVPGIESLRRGMTIFHYLRLAWQSIRAILFLNNLIRQEKIGLVHSVTINCWVGGFAARLARVPSVYHIHDLTLSSSRMMGVLIGLVLFVSSDKTLCVSKAALESLPLYSWNHSRASILRNAIDPTAFYPDPSMRDSVRSELGLRPDSCVVGSFGTLEKRKGQDIFIQAAVLVVTKVQMVEFLIVGSESTGYEGRLFYQKLKKLANIPELEGRVQFLNYRKDVPRLMQTVDIVVQPSRIEAGPIVPLESMATEVPVVATNVGAISEEVFDGINGILVPGEDPVSMAEVIIALINNREERKRLGEAGRRIVLKDFNLTQRATELGLIYESLLKRDLRNGNRQGY
jgi:glycosyltransferase involved in cell wall biosynthesis